MKKQLLLCGIFLSLSFGINAQLFCPNDVTVSCLSDLTPDECGMATVVSGNYHPSMIKYIDQDETNACNEGVVYRRFYLDVDYNNTYTENEPSCVQTISMVYENLPLNIQYPSDKVFTCLDDIPVESPTWLLNPCDLVGYTYEDEIFEFEEGACLKIVRTYSVINWCVYDVNAADGLYTGVQIIKIQDEESPEIEDCEDKYFDTNINCEASVTLTNAATDSGDCPSGMLTWRVSIDLWGDGTDDLFYGPNEPTPFKLNPVANGESVNVVLPEALGISKHKVVWKVTDGCGNVRSCSNEFFIEDNKPPTPYCLNFTSASLDGSDGGQIVISASSFNVDKVDNCSSKDDITISFSENIEDTEKVIACGDTGFQFFRIYYTDEAGNQDFCEVFMLIFDNGTCFGKYAPHGNIFNPNGTSIKGAVAYLMDDDETISIAESDDSGFFSFGSQDLMANYHAVVKMDENNMEGVDIEDFILMRSALLGLEGINIYQKMAADINKDNSFDIDDLYDFREVLLGRTEIAKENAWRFIPKLLNMNENQLNLNVSSTIPYTSYNDGFDYYGVKTGDLTGASYFVDDLDSSIEEIELTLNIFDDKISILSNDNLETDAYQFDIAVTGLNLSGESKNIAYHENGNRTRYTDLTSSNSFKVEEELFSAPIKIEEIDHPIEIVKSAKIFKKGNLKPSKIKWTVIDSRVASIDTNAILIPNIYPLPLQDRLTVEAKGITSLALFSITGERVDITTSIHDMTAEIENLYHLPRGVYFLKVIAFGKESIVKIVK